MTDQITGCCTRSKALPKTAAERCLFVNRQLTDKGLFGNPKRATHSDQNTTWRISPEPFWLDVGTYRELEELGSHLYGFYQACQRLYRASVEGRQPDWIRRYLEAGKPERVIEFGRMNRFRSHFPRIIRPDVILTGDGYVVTELDSVPGGFGLLAALSEIYSELGFQLPGGPDAVVRAFARAMLSLKPDVQSPTIAIVVSEESKDYWDEMVWMGEALQSIGIEAVVATPDAVRFCDHSLMVRYEGGWKKVDILYRFFELFDLKNIPMIDLILYAIRKGEVVATPPLKSYLEEKLLFAMFHHPALEGFWHRWLPSKTHQLLKRVFPMTWVMDPTPLPPHAVIPGLKSGGRAVTDWQQLKEASKKERELVLKPSGFSELAWGSRGVTVGHDVSGEVWSRAIDTALAGFEQTPYVLQEFHKGARVQASFYDFQERAVKPMSGRVRLCPYYFVSEDSVELAGVLGTACPLDKKVIHGMVDAVMVPAAVPPAPKPERGQ